MTHDQQQNQIRNQRIVIFALFIVMGISFIASWFIYDAIPITNTHQLDSLNFVHAIERKQFEGTQRMLLQNINDSDKRNQMLVNENKSLWERSNNQAVQYSQVVKMLRQTAPDTCQPYIEQIDIEHNKVVNAKDDVIDGLITRLDNRDSTIVERDSLISLQREQMVKDSANYAVNKEALQSDNKKLERKAKVVKFFNKVLIGAAVVFTAVVRVMTMGK